MSSQKFHKQPTLVDFEDETKLSLPPRPKEIGGYPIESLLGQGGMSLLYLALHPETTEPLTIKVLSAEFVSRPDMVSRFMKEAEIIELTDHPNIVKLYGHGEWEGGLYIAMEFIQGISLRELILQQALPLKRSLETIIQIGHALTHLHAHGIIHRDLKPENILLTAQGGVKVIDFGIAQLHKWGTAKKEVTGTPVYMSPEQREHPERVSFATDIYSLGIILYELVLGRLSHGVIHLHLLPKGLQRICAKALQPEIEDRYPDIVDFIQEVQAYLDSGALEKELRGSDYLGELGESLRRAQTVLIPGEVPSWPHLEMGIVSNSRNALSAVYYDFFQSQEGAYHIVMGESLASGVEGLLYVATLRGMIRSLADVYEQPTELISKLNAQLLSEEHEQSFSLCYLSLEPLQNRFQYLSCGYSPLWHLPAGSEVPRRISTDNIALGIDPNLDPLVMSSSFNVADQLVMHTFQAGLAKSVSEVEEDESHFLEALKESLFLTPSKQAESIFRKVHQKENKQLFERPITVVTVQRKE